MYRVQYQLFLSFPAVPHNPVLLHEKCHDGYYTVRQVRLYVLMVFPKRLWPHFRVSLAPLCGFASPLLKLPSPFSLFYLLPCVLHRRYQADIQRVVGGYLDLMVRDFSTLGTLSVLARFPGT